MYNSPQVHNTYFSSSSLSTTYIFIYFFKRVYRFLGLNLFAIGSLKLFIGSIFGVTPPPKPHTSKLNKPNLSKKVGLNAVLAELKTKIKTKN